MLWVLDLDGVVWLGEDAIPGSVDAVARIRRGGNGVLFMTNNSSARVDEYLAKLEGIGVTAEPDELVSSAQAAASMVDAGSDVLVCGGPGVGEAIEARGAHPRRTGPADAVIVGWHRDFDYDRLTEAFRAVVGGARLIGTNDDPTYPMPDGPVPGGGAILAAVAAASGRSPEVAGKPHEPMAALARSRPAFSEDGIVVGDRPSTDGLMAVRLGLPFALVLSGVTEEKDLPVEPEPAVVAPDLAALVGPDGGRAE